MGFFDKLKSGEQPATPTTPTNTGTKTSPLLTTKTVTKGQSHLLVRKSGGVETFTLITTWGKKDYDLYALVEYVDGHVEVVSCFGTMRHPRKFSLKTEDGAVRHVSGDKTAATDNAPQEVMSIALNPRIRCVVPVVYSAKNSGVGSFHRFQVSTYVIRGTHTTVPTDSSVEMVGVPAVDANRDETVYTFVPAVIHNEQGGARIEAVELYSRRGSELRPTVHNGKVTMDNGEENDTK